MSSHRLSTASALNFCCLRLCDQRILSCHTGAMAELNGARTITVTNGVDSAQKHPVFETLRKEYEEVPAEAV